MNYYFKVLGKYATFSGRARRSEYWYFYLFNIIISSVIQFLEVQAASVGVLSVIYALAVFLPGVAVGIRRMHDVGKSGWFLLIPFYNLYLACIDSEPGNNQYGENPKRN